MKEIKTRYAKMVNSKYYSSIEITSESLSEDELKSGYVFCPYTFGEHSEESLKQHDDFKKEYHNNHRFCPKCGGSGHSSTLVGYILNMDKKEEYKDLNRCRCIECGDVHYVHDRVSQKQISAKDILND